MLSTRFSVQPLAPALGAELQGLDILSGVDDAAFGLFRDALHRYSVVVVRGQRLSPEAQVAFSHRLGPTTDSEFSFQHSQTSDGVSEMIIISNIVEDGKEIGGDQRAIQANRIAESCEVELIALDISSHIHGARLFANRGDSSFRIRAGDAHQLLGMRIGERPQKDAVHQAEDGGVRANTERQREDGDRRKSRIAPQQACAVAQVLNQVFDPGPDPLIAGDAFDQGDVAEFTAGDASGFVRGCAAVDVVSRGHLEMGVEFLAQSG